MSQTFRETHLRWAGVFWKCFSYLICSTDGLFLALVSFPCQSQITRDGTRRLLMCLTVVWLFCGFLVCFTFHMSENKAHQEHDFIQQELRSTYYSNSYSNINKLHLSGCFLQQQFFTCPRFDLHRLFRTSILAHFSVLFCLISFVFRNGSCLDLHPFSPPLSPSPCRPFSSPTHFFTFPLTITHPHSPTFPLFPSTPLFSCRTHLNLSQLGCYVQRDPDRHHPTKFSKLSSVHSISALQIHPRCFLCILVHLTSLFLSSSKPWCFQAPRSSMVQELLCFSFHGLRLLSFFLSVKPQSCSCRSSGKIKATLFSFPSQRAAPSASSIRERDSCISTGIFPGPARQECWIYIPLAHIPTHTTLA